MFRPLYSWEEHMYTLTRDMVSQKASLDMAAKRKFPPSVSAGNLTPAVQPVDNHFT
jgi:hypothetical protein